MTTDELIRISLIRDEVNKREIGTNEEAKQLVSHLFSTLNPERVVEECREWMEKNNIPLNKPLLLWLK